MKKSIYISLDPDNYINKYSIRPFEGAIELIEYPDGVETKTGDYKWDGNKLTYEPKPKDENQN